MSDFKKKIVEWAGMHKEGGSIRVHDAKFNNIFHVEAWPSYDANSCVTINGKILDINQTKELIRWLQGTVNIREGRGWNDKT
jgi:hypothetical protein